MTTEDKEEQTQEVALAGLIGQPVEGQKVLELKLNRHERRKLFKMVEQRKRKDKKTQGWIEIK